MLLIFPNKLAVWQRKFVFFLKNGLLVAFIYATMRPESEFRSHCVMGVRALLFDYKFQGLVYFVAAYICKVYAR